ncbi:MAG: copper homeostasis protein CutC [Clostridiales bacterium]|nr:copper homeostasis protein CutC [Clostridiales bacterium]
MGKILLEVCCGSADDVIQAHKAGADRAELNSDLFHGGLTPTLGELIVAKRETGMKVIAMVRPREGGFCYTEAEFATAVEDAKLLLAHGADGLAFGFLHGDGTLDVERARVLAELAREAGKESVFHRAIDVVPDWREALDALIALGVTRVLTSGQEPDVPQGADTIREMIRYAAGRIEILPGGGIKARNVERVVAQTGCAQVHLSGHRQMTDPSAMNSRAIHYGGCLYPPEDQFRMVDSGYISGLVSQLGNDPQAPRA